MKNINYSIPVTLFDYRESENSLYSYAKLKIFYVGMTGDKRLFTKSFSNKLLKSLPYVPVVAYYDEDDEDFKGHNLSVQYVYGFVPADTEIEYIEEDGKEYALCDVLLYTGRRDRTGEIAQKIVGKGHSLELNPADTKYVINKNSSGHVQSMEFTEGSLLGLSVLGDNEKPAFSGSQFFNAQSEFMQMFADFKATMIDIFAKENNERGETMAVKTDNPEVTPEVAVEPEVKPVDDNLNADLIVEPVVEPEVKPEVEPEVVPEPITMTKEEKLVEAFMKVTNQEKEMELMKAVYAEFGEYCYVVQLSTDEQVLVYMDYSAELAYYRVSYTKEEGEITFGDKVEVKARFLSEDEINAVFVETPKVEQEPKVEPEVQGTIDKQEGEFDETIQEEKTAEKSQEELEQAALNQSERAELEAFRKEEKIELVNSFKEDLSKDFIDAIEVDKHSKDELEVILSKEFTRATRENRAPKPTQNAFMYKDTEHNSQPETDVELVNRLVSIYKTN